MEKIKELNNDYFFIFLDIDGVFNHRDFYRGYSIDNFILRKEKWRKKYNTPCLNERRIQEFVQFINNIKNKKVVGILSSSWRGSKDILERLNFIFRDFGCKYTDLLISRTGHSTDGFRGGEIKEFIEENMNCIKHFKTFNYLIIDDDADFYDYQLEKHFYHTNQNKGFIYKEAISICKKNKIL